MLVQLGSAFAIHTGIPIEGSHKIERHNPVVVVVLLKEAVPATVVPDTSISSSGFPSPTKLIKDVALAVTSAVTNVIKQQVQNLSATFVSKAALYRATAPEDTALVVPSPFQSFLSTPSTIIPSAFRTPTSILKSGADRAIGSVKRNLDEAFGLTLSSLPPALTDDSFSSLFGSSSELLSEEPEAAQQDCSEDKSSWMLMKKLYSAAAEFTVTFSESLSSEHPLKLGIFLFFCIFFVGVLCASKFYFVRV